MLLPNVYGDYTNETDNFNISSVYLHNKIVGPVAIRATLRNAQMQSINYNNLEVIVKFRIILTVLVLASSKGYYRTF